MVLGLSYLQARHRYQNAQIDLRAFTQLSAISFVGLLVSLGIYFFDGMDKLGAVLWSLMFLTLTVWCVILAKKSHKAVKTWEKVYNEAIERDK